MSNKTFHQEENRIPGIIDFNYEHHGFEMYSDEEWKDSIQEKQLLHHPKDEDQKKDSTVEIIKDYMLKGSCKESDLTETGKKIFDTIKKISKKGENREEVQRKIVLSCLKSKLNSDLRSKKYKATNPKKYTKSSVVYKEIQENILKDTGIDLSPGDHKTLSYVWKIYKAFSDEWINDITFKGTNKCMIEHFIKMIEKDGERIYNKKIERTIDKLFSDQDDEGLILKKIKTKFKPEQKKRSMFPLTAEQFKIASELTLKKLKEI